MKNGIRTLTVATALSLIFAGPALAMTASNQSVWQALNTASFANPTLTVAVHDGVVTLAGDVQDAMQKHAIEQVVRNSEGVTGVLNLITSN